MRIMHVNIGGFGGAVDGITSAESQLVSLLEGAGHQVIRLDESRQGTMVPASAMRIARQARRERVDVVHLHSLFRPAHSVLALLLSLWRIPYVVSPHAALAAAALQRDGIRKQLFLDLFDGPLLRGAATVVCLTEREVAEVAAIAPAARTSIVPNPYTPGVCTPWAWTERERPALVSLARYDVYHKGLDYLAGLAAELPEADIRVHGMPDHNEPELLGALVRTAPPNFSLQAPVVGADKLRTLSTANLYVQASRWEGLSIALIEALAAGIPVAVSPAVADTVPVRELGCGVVMSPDPALAARDIRTLLADPDALVELGAAGRRWVSEALSPQRVLSLLVETYAAAAARPGGAPGHVLAGL